MCARTGTHIERLIWHTIAQQSFIPPRIVLSSVNMPTGNTILGNFWCASSQQVSFRLEYIVEPHPIIYEIENTQRYQTYEIQYPRSVSLHTRKHFNESLSETKVCQKDSDIQIRYQNDTLYPTTDNKLCKTVYTHLIIRLPHS